jgi:hypothetical protein
LIKTGLALTGLILSLIFLLSLELPLAPSSTNSGYTCYGVECVDRYPSDPRTDWGDQIRWCEKMVWTEQFKLNHNTTRIIFHQYCYL